MQSVQQLSVEVKPFAMRAEFAIGELAPHRSKAWKWGYNDALEGLSWAEGFMLFAGDRLKQYLAGHTAGTQARAYREALVAPADFVEALIEVEQNGIVYCLPLDIEAIESEMWGD